MDYLNAGLLDRAEALFHQLMGDREYGRRSAIALIELYQQEREWEKAAQVAKTLTRGDADPATFKALAYITCELSDTALSRNARSAAGTVLNAEIFDRVSQFTQRGCRRGSGSGPGYRRTGRCAAVGQSSDDPAVWCRGY